MKGGRTLTVVHLRSSYAGATLQWPQGQRYCAQSRRPLQNHSKVPRRVIPATVK
jgi:hypothetical protein